MKTTIMTSRYLARLYCKTARHSRLRRARRFRLAIEQLEDRLALASWSGDVFDTVPGTPLWTKGEVQQIIGDVHVPAGKTLTIHAGTVVKFDGDRSLTVDGTLQAQGTTVQPIVFTSYRDDSAGGDTNNNGPSVGSGADWSRIQFNSGSTANVMNHVEVRYSGGSGTAAVIDDGAPLELTNSTIRTSGLFVPGLRINAANPRIANVTIRDINTAAAIAADLLSQPIIRNMTLTNNAVNGLRLDGGTIETDVTWNNPGIVYELGNTVTVAAGKTLTIGAGQVVKASGPGLIVDGTLKAQGATTEPIVFTSYRDDAAGGDTNNNGPSIGSGSDWSRIQFNSGSTGNVMDHVDVRYSGGGGVAAVVVDGAWLTLTNSTISNTGLFVPGLRINAANPVIAGVTIRDINTAAAIVADLRSQPIISNMTLTNNAVNGVRLDGGTISASVSWNNPGIVYQLDDTVTVAANNTLTIGAGQVVKFRSARLIVDGTLNAQGTATQPIVLTSYRDDSAGGDTDENGPTSGTPADWRGIFVRSTSTGSMLDHVLLRYAFGAGEDQQAAIEVNAAPLTLANSMLSDGIHDGLMADTGSTVTISNSIIRNVRRGILALAGSQLTAVNNTIDNNASGVELDGTTATLTNNLITYSGNVGIDQTGPTSLTMSFNDVYNPGASNYTGLADQTGSNGNISADPKYFHRSNSQYELRAGSPAVDAGTSDGTPTKDFVGNSRFDDPNVLNRGGGSMPFSDLGAIERQETAMSHIDLAATSVSGPAHGMQDEVVTINWTVASAGSGAALGAWYDAVYLSSGPVFTPDAIFLGDLLHTGDLGPGQSYSASAILTLPGVVPGEHYFIVRANSRNEVFEGFALVNNTTASSAVSMDLPALSLGTPLSDQLATIGAAKLYKVTTSAESDLNVVLTGPNGDTNELFVSYGEVPTRQSFDARGVRTNSANQSVSLANTRAGTYYILVYGANVTAGDSFTLTAATLGFSIAAVTPIQGSNTGQVTLTITGAQFNINSQPLLIDSAGGTINPVQVYFTDSGELWATFDLTGHPTGAADVQIVNENVTATLLDGFNIVTGHAGRLVTNISAPSGVRLGRSFQIMVEYANEGDADLLAPIMHLATAHVLTPLSFTPDLADAANEIDLVGVNPRGPAGVLPPGARGSITVYGTAPISGNDDLQLSIGDYGALPIDWAAIKPLIRPGDEDLSDADYDALFARLQQNIGDTWDAYPRVIAADATLYPASRGVNHSLRNLLQLEIDKAFAQIHPSIHGQLFLGDTHHPLGNVTIQLFDATTQEFADAISFTDGTFLIPFVRPGTYRARVNGYNLTGLNELTMDATDLDAGKLIVAPGAVLTGSVVLNPGGMPARGVTVLASSDFDVFSTTTDGDGRYQIDGLPAGIYEVSAGGDPYTDATLAGLNVNAGQVQPHVNLILEMGGSISGVVSGPGGPIPAVVVTALTEDGIGRSTTSGADGSYKITGLSAQEYTVGVMAPGLVDAGVENVTVSAGETTTGVNLSPTQAGSLTGQVMTLADGSAVAGVLLNIEGSENTYASVSDGSGNFLIEHLPPGVYTISTASDHVMSATVMATVVAGTSTPITLTVAARGEVSGTVTKATSGQPLANVVVYVADANGLIGSTVTNTNGSYQLTGFEAGTYQVIVGDMASPGVARSQVVFDNTHTTATANFEVSVAGIVRGTVFEADRVTAIADATVALSQNGILVQTMATDEQGHYSFVVVRSGTYQVEAAEEGLVFPEISNIALSGGANVTGQDFHAGSEILNVLVQDAGGQPLGDATVSVFRSDAGLTLTHVAAAITLVDGTFHFTGLRAGSFRVLAHANGYAVAQQSVTIVSGTSANATFSLGEESSLWGTIGDGNNGLSLADAVLRLVSTGNPSLSAAAVTDVSGNYRFGSLTPGAYNLVVTATNHQAAVLHNLTIGEGNNVLSVGLDAPTILVNGDATDGAMPLRQVLITARDSAGLIVSQTSTGADGTFQLNELPAGTYQLTASAAGYLGDSSTSVTVTAGQTITDVHFMLDAVSLSDPPSATRSRQSGDYAWITELQAGPEFTPAIKPLSPSRPECNVERGKAEQAIQNANEAYERWLANWAGINLFTDTLDNFPILLRNIESNFLAVLAAVESSNQLGAGSIIIAKMIRDLGVSLKAGQFSEARPGVAAAVGLLKDLANQTSNDSENATSGPPLPSQNAIAEALRDLASSIDKLRDPLDLFAAYRKAEAGFNTLRAAVDAPVAAYEDCVKQHTPGLASIESPVVSVIGLLGAPIRIVPPPPPPDPPPDPPPNKAPDTLPGPTVPIVVGRSIDPNEITGPAGFGPESFIKPGTLPYRVDFENDPAQASAAAQVVVVSLTLDADLDPSTFTFTGFGFGPFRFTVPAGLYHYETTLDLRPHGINLLVPVTLDENPVTGVVTVTFESLDPLTRLAPDGINDGFLPVNNANHDGEGFFTFTVRPKAGLPTGTTVDAQAFIVFDINEPLATPTAHNTLDVGAPTSAVTALPAQQDTPRFAVNWSGSDDPNGSGIGTFDVYVSDNGGPFVLFVEHSAATSAEFTGVDGHTYRFYSVATDHVRHVEAKPTPHDAETRIVLEPTKPWQNPANPRDVTGDGNVVPLDVLAVINELNNRRFSNPDSGLLLERPADATLFYDVNGDRFATPLDALNIINFLNARVGVGEGVSLDEERAMFGELMSHNRTRRDAQAAEPRTSTRLGGSLVLPLPRPPIEPRPSADGKQNLVVDKANCPDTLESNVDQAFAEDDWMNERPISDSDFTSTRGDFFAANLFELNRKR